MTGLLFLIIPYLEVEICNSTHHTLHVISVSVGITRLAFLTIPCLEIDIRNPTQEHRR
jgi:hypothetical protein